MISLILIQQLITDSQLENKISGPHIFHADYFNIQNLYSVKGLSTNLILYFEKSYDPAQPESESVHGLTKSF